MNDEEEGVWNVLTTGLAVNDALAPSDVLQWAIDLGAATGVPEWRVRQIYQAIQAGIQPGTPPL